MKNIFSLLALLFATLLMSSPVFSAVQVNASVSSTNVILGDMFILTISIDDNDDDYQLNTKILEQDFTVYRPSKSQRTEFINGSFSQNTQWQVRLQAKKEGSLTIPALKIGDYLTKPIQIKVTKVSQTNIEQDDEIFIENSINKDSVYIGQSFIYTTKLYISKNSNDLELKAPHFQGAENSVLGQDTNEQIVKNGMRYNTITRQYKITATQAGQYEIDSPLLTGTVQQLVAVSDRQNRVISNPINIRGEQLNINIKAIPEDYQGQWIVSNDLRLIENNDLTAQSYQVGEPITRSITLQIASIEKDKLPNIKLNYPPALRFYPDQDQLEEGQANNLNYGVRIIRHAIIADKVGTLTLPEIRLNWFNSQTEQQETAILPEQQLTIIAADKQQVNTTTTAPPIAVAPKTTIIVDHSALIYWQISVAVLIIIIVLIVLYHLAYRRKMVSNQQNKPTQVPLLNEHYLALQKHLQQANANLCYSALLLYAQQDHPRLKSLNQLPEYTNLSLEEKQRLTEQIQYLQLCCSDTTIQWNATALIALIDKIEKSKEKRGEVNLMDINP
tara:strand:- start:627 stop:2300 length:1674 start_codon:yes stop_codon:yes gene_type:complete